MPELLPRACSELWVIADRGAAPMAPTGLTFGDVFIPSTPPTSGLPKAERLLDPSNVLEPESAPCTRHLQQGSELARGGDPSGAHGRPGRPAPCREIESTSIAGRSTLT
eukprot:3101097-Pleurochrysis_carterae.AAC.2